MPAGLPLIIRDDFGSKEEDCKSLVTSLRIQHSFSFSSLPDNSAKFPVDIWLYVPELLVFSNQISVFAWTCPSIPIHVWKKISDSHNLKFRY